LRGIAIILVMFLHAHFQLGKGGGIGVEMFFVISGFLITKKLLDEYDKTGYISLKYFWIKRLCRLVPALYILLILVLFYVFLFVNSSLSQLYKQEIIDSSLFISNLSWFWSSDSYEKILGQTWSLSVEQQFYFIWPIFLIYILNYFKSKIYLILIFLFVLMLHIFKLCNITSAIVESLVHESLYIGCLLALLIRNNLITGFQFQFLSWFSFIVLIVLGLFKLDFCGLFFERGFVLPFINLLMSFLILHCVFNSNSSLNKVLNIYPLRFIGKISYGLYLWHLPIFRIFKLHLDLPPAISFILKFVFTFILAILSYFFIEKKMIRLGNKFHHYF
jgi:peptidoglycan/LPS O-acetylase OafA/YrhL